MHYNFVRIHQSLRITPAMAAGWTSKLSSLTHMVRVIENREAAHPANPGDRLVGLIYTRRRREYGCDQTYSRR